MRKYALAALGITAAAVAAVLVGPNLAGKGTASSHREAPLIAEDPSGDNTDLYAFRSPDKPNTLTIVSNWIPGEDPAAGPNWYTFSPSARYNIKIDRNGDGRADITYAFRFKTATGPLFLGNTTQSFTVMRNGKRLRQGHDAAEQHRSAAARLPRRQGLQGRGREVDRLRAGRREGLRRPA